jgi:8-oxo-dGTP diphosphatase
MTVVRVVAAVVWRGDDLLLTQRPPGGPLGLQWEFPGGKIEAGESAGAALAREINEELGVTATPGRVLGTERHVYEHGLEVEITFIECALAATAFRPSPAVHRVRWSRPDAIAPAELLEADRAFVRRLAAGRIEAARGAAPDPASGE